MKRILIALAGLTLALAGLGQPAQASTHPVGSHWTENGVRFTQVDPVAQMGTYPAARRAGSDCQYGYLCLWANTDYQGTIWRYSTSYIADHGNCYNVATANNNVTSSLVNNSPYSGAVHNWINCNSPAGPYIRGTTSFTAGAYLSYQAYGATAGCYGAIPYTLPCNWISSIAADNL